MKKHLLQFIKSISIFLVIFLVLDQIIGSVLENYYFKAKSAGIHQTLYAMDSTMADIIILGSSRANHHYIPDVFEESLGMSCYNTGKDGNFLFYNYAVFRAIMERYAPKIIILDINESEFYYDQKYYEELAEIMPFFKSKTYLQDLLLLKSPIESIKLTSKIYPFNSKILSIVNGRIGKDNYTHNKGYLPLYGTTTSTTKVDISKEKINTFDNNKMNVLDSIAFYCDTENVKLFVIQSPRFVKKEGSKLRSSIQYLLTPYGFSYWDYMDASMLDLDYTFYRDAAHLNHNGALLFSRSIAGKLKAEIFNSENETY